MEDNYKIKYLNLKNKLVAGARVVGSSTYLLIGFNNPSTRRLV